jgi:hypothetical protein
MYNLYSTLARTEHFGIPWTPAAKILGEECSPPYETLNFLLVKKEEISLTRLVENCSSDSLYSRPRCHVVSKASLSENTAGVDIFLLKFRET